MAYPLSERMPNGVDATFALLPASWRKLLARRVDPSEDQDPQQPIALQSGVRAPERMESDDTPIVAPRQTDGGQVDELTLAGLPMHRPRYASPQQPEPVLPIAPKTLSSISARDDVRGGDATGKAMPVDPNELPQIPSRNFSQYVLAPDQTKNPDYTPETIATRPKVVDELGYAETHTPMPRHGRIVEGLKGAGLGFLRGVGATGTLGGGIGGAATLGTMSAIDPKYAESAQNQMFTIPHLQQQEATRIGRQTAATKQAEAQAGLRKTQAETADIIDRPVRERIKTAADIAKDNRTRTEVERHNKAMETLTGTSRADSQKRFEETQRHNRAMEEIGRGRSVETGYAQDVVAQNEQDERERAAKIAQDQSDYQQEVSNRRDASTAVTNYNRTYRALQQNLSAAKQHDRDRAALETQYKDKTDANYKKASDALEARKIHLEEENQRLKDEAEAAGAELINSGIHTKYVKQLPSGYFELGPEPQRPSVPPASPVRSRRMPPQQTSAPPISEDAFVEAARQKMGRSFDEGKARAAWQKKYGGH